MPQVQYINRGDSLRLVRIIHDDASVEEYELNTVYPEHVQLIIQLDQEATARANIAGLWIDPEIIEE